MYKVLHAESVESFETYINDFAKEGWRVHSWQDSDGEAGIYIIIVLIKECPAK